MTQTPILSVREVVKTYGDVRAVQGVSFDVRPGEVFGFLGPNGAGKTTTLRMIMGITRPDGGEVRFAGDGKLDRTRVGYLPEERGLFEDGMLTDTLVYLGTLRGMPRAAATAAAHRWLERLGLADRAQLKAKVGTLSKGNQQKVQLAGAILHEPTLAVLDEPFSGLDPLNQELFIELIRELRDRGAAVLLSAHQLNLVERLCDRIVLISKGRVLLSGTLAEIRARAAGGAGEVMTLHLRAGGAAPAEVAGALRGVPGVLAAEGRAGLDGRVQVDVSLPDGAELGPVLAAAGARYPIERVGMHELSLHEIYVRAVGGDHATAAAEEAARV